MRMEEAKALAQDYTNTWQRAGYDFDRIRKDVMTWKGEDESLYYHLLSVLRGVPYDMYPDSLKQYDLDGHLSSIVKKTLVYLNPPSAAPTPQQSDLDVTKQSVSLSVSEEDPSFIGPIIPEQEEEDVVVAGANARQQLPPRRYLLATV